MPETSVQSASSARPKRDVDPVRAQRRRELVAARAALPDRAEREARLLGHVAQYLSHINFERIGFFWATRAEPDLSTCVAAWLRQSGSRMASLPVIEGELLTFAPWSPGDALVRGPFDVLVPGTELRIAPQLLLIPCVGVDRLRYRLGYGGGYYDRTLAALSPRPVTVGVGFDCARIESIDPKAHDLQLDAVITESGTC